MIKLQKAMRNEFEQSAKLSVCLTGLAGVATLGVMGLKHSVEGAKPNPVYDRTMTHLYWMDGGLVALSVLFYAGAAFAKSKIKALQNPSP